MSVSCQSIAKEEVTDGWSSVGLPRTEHHVPEWIIHPCQNVRINKMCLGLSVAVRGSDMGAGLPKEVTGCPSRRSERRVDV